MNTKTLRMLALTLLFFLGITGLWGGYELMKHPSGDSLEMPMELLENTPFDDYLIPGILLFFGNGALSLIIAGLTIKKVRHYPYLIVFQGTILLIWLTTELIMNIDFFFPQTHIAYYLVSILLIIVGRRLHRSETIP